MKLRERRTWRRGGIAKRGNPGDGPDNKAVSNFKETTVFNYNEYS